MKDFIDRIAGKPNRYKMTKETDGSSEYVTMQLDDEPSKAGTPLNREAFMAVQGFQTTTTTFKEDGSIEELNADNDLLKTVFNEDGSIDEIFTSSSGETIKNKIIFESDGTIRNILS